MTSIFVRCTEDQIRSSALEWAAPWSQTPALLSLDFAASSIGDSGPIEARMILSRVVVTGLVMKSGHDLMPIIFR